MAGISVTVADLSNESERERNRLYRPSHLLPSNPHDDNRHSWLNEHADAAKKFVRDMDLWNVALDTVRYLNWHGRWEHVSSLTVDTAHLSDYQIEMLQSAADTYIDGPLRSECFDWVLCDTAVVQAYHWPSRA